MSTLHHNKQGLNHNPWARLRVTCWHSHFWLGQSVVIAISKQTTVWYNHVEFVDWKNISLPHALSLPALPPLVLYHPDLFPFLPSLLFILPLLTNSVSVLHYGSRNLGYRRCRSDKLYSNTSSSCAAVHSNLSGWSVHHLCAHRTIVRKVYRGYVYSSMCLNKWTIRNYNCLRST